MTNIFKGTMWENNKSAQVIIREWFRKANKDAGNYFTRQLEDLGFCGDNRSGADWGNLPSNYQEHE